MEPFLYPVTAHARRHGPFGYGVYESFRPWVRDEFLFRCVYCLKREQWGTVKGQYALEHFRPQAQFDEAALDYTNLLYACLTCNSAKRAQVVPNPCDCMLQDRVTVTENGAIVATEKEARRLIKKLGLDDPEYREFRSLWIGILAMARERRPRLFVQIMKYPDTLPDLSKLKPMGNTRPEGVVESCYARRARGELPEIY